MFLKLLIFIIILVILIFAYNYYEIIQIENFLNQTKNNFNLSQIKSHLQNSPIGNIQQNVLFNNKDYNENLSIDNKNNKYYYNDTINQSNINETAFNVEYSIDPIDYSNVKTGIEKCNKQCDGICFENGYDGIATCYPTEQQGFDYGTLYKNPSFTYGSNAYNPNNKL